MKLARPVRRSHPETIVALIDVVFFLLIFFMLVGRMDATAPFSVIPPVASTGTEMPGGGTTLSIGAGGELALDGVSVDRGTLTARIAKAIARNPRALIRINAARDAELSLVLPLVAALEAQGAANVVLVVTPGRP